MARFQVDIEKRLGSEFWSNVWQVQATDLASAQTVGAAIAGVERSFHAQAVTFTRYRVSSVAMNDGVYTIVPIGQPGQRNIGALLPLFNTLRMDFTAVTGRPSRKFFRGVLSEADIDGESVDTAPFLTASLDIFDLFATTAEQNAVVDPQGQFLTAIVVHPFVQMRQLRRSRRRRESGSGIFQ